MPAERVSMRQAREIIRLKFSSFSTHEIARRLGMARSTVREVLQRAESAALSWPQAEGMSDAALEGALYANRRSRRGHRRIAEPDWASVHREMKRKHVTLTILWDEYIAANPGGFSYSRYCDLYVWTGCVSQRVRLGKRKSLLCIRPVDRLAGRGLDGNTRALLASLPDRPTSGHLGHQAQGAQIHPFHACFVANFGERR